MGTTRRKKPNTAALVAALLRGEGERWECWWGGEGFGHQTTHTHHVSWWREVGQYVEVVLPLPADATHQLRRALSQTTEYYTNHNGNPKHGHVLPHEISNIRVSNNPKRKRASVKLL